MVNLCRGDINSLTFSLYIYFISREIKKNFAMAAKRGKLNGERGKFRNFPFYIESHNMPFGYFWERCFGKLLNFNAVEVEAVELSHCCLAFFILLLLMLFYVYCQRLCVSGGEQKNDTTFGGGGRWRQEGIHNFNWIHLAPAIRPTTVSDGRARGN